MADMALIHDELNRYKRERDEAERALKWRVREFLYLIEGDAEALHCAIGSTRQMAAQFIIKTTQYEDLKELLSGDTY